MSAAAITLNSSEDPSKMNRSHGRDFALPKAGIPDRDFSVPKHSTAEDHRVHPWTGALWPRLSSFSSGGCCMALVVSLTAIIGASMAFVWLGDDYQPPPSKWHSVSVMLASGRGWVNPQGPMAPELKDFLDHKTLSITPEIVGKIESLGEPDSFHQTHRYLFYAIGAVWWLLGISWNAIKIFQIILLCVTALLLYGLFRLGMNRVLSVAGTLLFVSSPLMLSHLLVERDFAKAPFILGAILVMGHLANRPSSSRRYFGLAALLGLIAGFGLGFRQDMLLCVPPSVGVLAICPLDVPGYAIRKRLTAVLLMLEVWFVTAYPILTVTADGAAQTAHSMVASFGCETNMSIPPGSYQLFNSFDDRELSAGYSSFASRTMGDSPTMEFSTPDAERRARAFFLQATRTFPADAANRFNAAAISILRNTWTKWTVPVIPSPGMARWNQMQQLLNQHWGRNAGYYLAAALLLLGFAGPRRAGIALALALYFCGMMNLQFAPQHFFHLCFLPLWVMGFIVDKIFRGAQRFLLCRDRFSLQNMRSSFWAAVRAAAFAAAAVIVFLCPLWGLRAYQHWTVGALLTQYQNATLEPVPIEMSPAPRSGLVAFRPTEWSAPDYHVLDHGPWAQDLRRAGTYLRTEYLVAELEADATPFTVGTCYETGTLETPEHRPVLFDLSSKTEISVASAERPMRVKFFFPVYEIATLAGRDDVRNRFCGILLPEEKTNALIGLYRVKNLSDFSFLLTLILPEDTSCFQRYKTLPSLFPASTPWAPDNPSPEFMAKAERLRERGDFRGSRAAFRKAIEWNPLWYAPCEGLSNLYVDRGDLAGLAREWQEAVNAHPERHLAWFCLGLALERQGSLDGAMAAYEKALQLEPSATGTLEALTRVRQEKGETPGMEHGLEDAAQDGAKTSQDGPVPGDTPADPVESF